MSLRLHGTLSASVVETVTVTLPAHPTVSYVDVYGATQSKTIRNFSTSVEVTNVDGADAIYFTIDGSTPTVAGADTYVLPAAAGASLLVGNSSDSKTVKMISDGTPQFSVACV